MADQDGDSVQFPVAVDELIKRFGWPDYVVFILMLVGSALIGVFFGWRSRRHAQKSGSGETEEFLMGGRNMSVFPTAMSLIASFMSAITLLGTPAEVYQFGTQYWVIGFSYFFVMPAAAYLYMPIFFKLRVTSAYQYLELRFHKVVQRTASVIFIVQMQLYMAIVVYAPSLALSQVTGINVYMSITLIFLVCIFYTTLGGMKAVMWTDTLQVIIMFTAMVSVIIKGCVDVGGPSFVWQKNLEGDRLHFFDFNPDPGVRHTVWTLVVGGYFTWITIYGVNQAMVQRYLCVPTLKQAQTAIWINLVGLFGLLTICAGAGLVIYAKYWDCDPLATKVVSTADQLFPLFVMDTLGFLPGLPGLFVAGIFSGALSTVSSGINSLAAITLNDFVIPCCAPNMTDSRATFVSKLVAIGYGILSFALVFVAEQLGDVLQAALSIFGMVGGPLLGVFTLGLFFPWANTIGAMVGTVVAIVFIFWIGFGFQVSKAMGLVKTVRAPTSLAGCPRLNITTAVTEAITTTTTTATTIASTLQPEEQGEILPIYTLSYMHYSFVACLTVVVVGLIVSFVTGRQNPRKLHPDLVVPVGDKLGCCLPRKVREFLNFDVGADLSHEELQHHVIAETDLPHSDTEKNGSVNAACQELEEMEMKIRSQ